MQLRGLPVGQGFEPDAQGDVLALGGGLVPLPLAWRNTDVYTHAGGVFELRATPAPLGLVHGVIMDSQIILDKSLDRVLTVITLNQEAAMANIKYFSGTTELQGLTGIPNARFHAAFPGVKGRRYDGYQMWVGRPVSGPDAILPVDRMITYKSFPSKHECNAKCMGGKVNGTCECKCGGKNHGVGSVIGKPMAELLRAAA